MKKYLSLFLLVSAYAQAQDVAPLTVQKIMRDPKWMGVSPSNYRWSEDSKTVFFNWNPENKEKDQPYKITVANTKPLLTDDKAIESAVGTNYVYNKDRSLGLYEKGGDIYFYNFKTKKETRLTNTVERENGARFLFNNDVVFQRGDNVYQFSLASNELKQLTNFVKGKRPGSEAPQRTSPVKNEQDNWLKTDQTNLFD
ncbi:MAG: S9 family peptidase, partial [Pedobacter sp.]